MSTYPPLVYYKEAAEYLAHYQRVYCGGCISTHDGIMVRFRMGNFEHIFYESSRRDGVKDRFSRKRAEHIDWIRAALQDASVPLYVGWDHKKKRYDHGRRVAVAQGNYVVVIHLTGMVKADHVTAYLADHETVSKIENGPLWV